MTSNKVINIKDNKILKFNSQITGQNVTVVQPAQKWERPKYIWFQMRCAITTFSGRNTELEEIHTILTEHKICVINGFAGMGKTETSRYYAWKYCEYYGKNVIWINAEEPESLKESFQKLATELHISMSVDGSKRDDISVIQQIYSYFENEKCLVIFDNVESRKDISLYLPSKLETHAGIHFLITSQNIEWGQMKSIELLQLPKSDAVQLMVMCLKNVLNTDQQMADIEELVELMQCLPLALQQAAAFIEDRNTYIRDNFTVSDYIRKFKAENFLLECTYHGSAFPQYSENDYRKTVFINISMILKKLRQEHVPLAVDILYMIAYFVPDDIDKDIFKPLLHNENEMDPVNEAIRILKKYSLVSIEDSNSEFSIHRLAQSVIRLHIKREGLEKCILKKALNLILVEGNISSEHSPHILKFAYEIKFLYEYYESCKNKKIFWFGLVRVQPSDIACTMLQSIKDFNYFKGDAIISLAVESNNTELVRLLIERGASVNTPLYLGMTPIIEAAKYCNLSMIKYLVENGANVNISDIMGNSPLIHAVYRRDIDIISYLLESGVDLNLPNVDALHEAAKYGYIDVIKIFLEKGADINSKYYGYLFTFAVYFNKDIPVIVEYTPLHMAASAGQLETVQFLVSRGAYLGTNETIDNIISGAHVDVLKYFLDVGICDASELPWNLVVDTAVKKNNESLLECFFELCPLQTRCLLYFAYHGYLNNVKLLIERGVHMEGEINGITLLHVAACNGKLDVVKYAISINIDINVVDDNGRTALHEAAQDNHVDVMNYLIKEGACVNQSNKNGDTPLFLACDGGHIDATECLINHGANVNHVNEIGNCVLHRICEVGNVEIVKYLLDHGADVNQKNRDGYSGVFCAASKGNLEVIKYLKTFGVDLFQTKTDGATPFTLAVACGHLETVKYFLEIGANVNGNCNSISPLVMACHADAENIMQFLLSQGADVNDKDKDGNSALHVAAWNGNLDIVKLLLKNKADIHSEDMNGNTALHQACISGHINVVSFLCFKGSNINRENKDKNTPLHLAVENGHVSIVQLLIEEEADISKKNKDGLKPLKLAKQKNLPEIIKCFPTSKRKSLFFF